MTAAKIIINQTSMTTPTRMYTFETGSLLQIPLINSSTSSSKCIFASFFQTDYNLLNFQFWVLDFL